MIKYNIDYNFVILKKNNNNKNKIIFISQHNSIESLFLQKKIGLYLSHLVPEILGPKVTLVSYIRKVKTISSAHD